LMEKIKDEGIKNPDRFDIQPDSYRTSFENAVKYILKKIDENMESFTNRFPSASSKNLVYSPTNNVDWTTGFWTGMLWLAYEYTGNEKYRRVAEIQVESFGKRIRDRIEVDTHDLGFMYTLSCVSAYKLTGNEEAKNIALEAAEFLATRYLDKASIIQAWGNLDNPEQMGRMIIDCNMNLPLLYWAHCVSGEKRFFTIAYNHIRQAAKYLVREDASSFHTFYMDVETGLPKFGKTRQGFSDSSCWARGQAWGIYGFPLN